MSTFAVPEDQAVRETILDLKRRLAILENQTIQVTSGSVSSVNGHSGVVTLTSTDVGAVPESTATTKGDLLAASGAAVFARLGVGADNTVLTADSTQPLGVKWGTASGGSVLPPVWSYSGALAVHTGIDRLYNTAGHTLTISQVIISVGTPSAGASIIVDVRKGGSTIFTTTANRPTISAGATYGTNGGTPDVPTIAAGEYWTVDVVQVGSTTAGASLTVQIVAS